MSRADGTHPVIITNLAMRFPVNEGWSARLLERYLVRGKLILRGFGPNESQMRYYILDVGSELDLDMMFKELKIVVYGKEDYGETKNLSDKDAMKTRNW